MRLGLVIMAALGLLGCAAADDAAGDGGPGTDDFIDMDTPPGNCSAGTGAAPCPDPSGSTGVPPGDEDPARMAGAMAAMHIRLGKELKNPGPILEIIEKGRRPDGGVLPAAVVRRERAEADQRRNLDRVRVGRGDVSHRRRALTERLPAPPVDLPRRGAEDGFDHIVVRG